MANTIQRDARNLAEATMCLVRAAKRMFQAMSNIDVELARDVDNSLDYAESEAKNILAKTEGA